MRELINQRRKNVGFFTKLCRHKTLHRSQLAKTMQTAQSTPLCKLKPNPRIDQFESNSK